MKFFKNNLKVIVICLSGLSLSACVSEEPIDSENGAETLVKFNVDINNAVTRTVDDSETSSLLNNCVLYISNSQGLLHKWQGIDNIPATGVYLKYGQYVAEAWAGDSISASFESKFYGGTTGFSISNNTIPTQVTVNCKIKNVVVSVDASQLPEFALNDLSINVASSSGQLEFFGEKLSRKGYFMRKYDKESKKYDSELSYTVSGIDVNGYPFTKDGVISGVQPAHEYCITLEVGEMDEGAFGGAVFNIKVVENEIEDDFIIHSAPQFKWGDGRRISSTLQPSSGENFSEHTLYIGGYQDLKSLIFSINNDESGDLLNAIGGNDNIDLIYMHSDVKEALIQKGIEITQFKVEDINTYAIKFKPEWFNNLTTSTDNPYSLKITAVDKRNLSNSMEMKIRTMFAPFFIDGDLWKNDLLSIRAHSAQINLNVDEVVEGLHLEYREKNGENTDWIQFDSANPLTTGENIVKITGLKADTDYEVRAVGGEFSDNRYKYEIEPSSFRTEGIFEIPNAGMEEWFYNNSDKSWEPASDATHKFWDTGNHGSAKYGYTLTQSSTNYSQSGTSAYLYSQNAIIQFAAGNLFVGEFVEPIIGNPMGAKVNFGKNFNNSHPIALKVYVRYIPVKVDKWESNCPDPDFKKGVMDQGQIFVALASRPSELNTAKYNYFNPEGDNILAYGEVTFYNEIGDSTGMAEIIIPLKYDGVYEGKANKIPASHIIIVCSASKYGDYFTGGVGSKMYLDDFQFLYEEV